MNISLLLADDHPVLLQGLVDLVRGAGHFDLVASTTSGREAIERIRTLQPAIAVLDLSMPDLGGMDILRTVHLEKLPTQIVFLTATITGQQARNAIALGVRGIVTKDYATEHLLECLDHVADGRTWIPTSIRNQVARSTVREREASQLAGLTAREKEVAALVCAGLSNRAIAAKLGSAEGTVGIHLSNIYRKLEISSRTMLAALLVKHGPMSDEA